MEIKVLGTGCAGCKALYAIVTQVVKELALEAVVTKEEDLMKIMEYNVMTLPALVVFVFYLGNGTDYHRYLCGGSLFSWKTTLCNLQSH